MQWQSTCLSLFALLSCLSGCGRGPSDAVLISGTATFEGQPIAKGNITFMPIDGKIAPDAGTIVDGKFAFPAKLGAKRVEIGASRTGSPDPEMKSPNQVQYIPRQYNIDSQLTVEVRRNSENHFTFNLRRDGAVKSP